MKKLVLILTAVVVTTLSMSAIAGDPVSKPQKGAKLISTAQ